MVVLSAADCSKPLYAKFQNGIAYGYISGDCSTVENVRDPAIGRYVNV